MTRMSDRVHVRDCVRFEIIEKSISEDVGNVLSCLVLGKLGLLEGVSHGRETGRTGGGTEGTFAACI